ncbi:MAG TPA: hypothetical protein VN903_36640, partial [Polyangia bacterium]|nr:hypothetical protein [Polyangia bacterium]
MRAVSLVLAAASAIACAARPRLASGPSARAVAAPESVPCAPGTLLFSASEAPTAIALSPDGTLLVVADRGGLTVRDPATLRPLRYLLPTLNQWTDVAFIGDDRTVEARTVDGIVRRIDARTGEARRAPAAGGAEVDAGGGANADPSDRFEQDGLWLSELRHRPAQALANDDARRRESAAQAPPFVIAGDRVRASDRAGHAGAETTTPPGTHAVHLDVSGTHLLVALDDGGAAIYRIGRDTLTLERRIPAPDHAGAETLTDRMQRLYKPEAAVPRHLLMRLAYDHARGRLIWLSTAHELGVADVAAGRSLARLRATGAMGADRVIFLDDAGRSLLAVADGSLWFWDTATGETAARAGGYRSAAAAAGGRALAARADGWGDVVEARTLRVESSLCLLGGGCRPPATTAPPPGSTAALEDLAHARIQHYVELASSPDGTRGAALEWPVRAPADPLVRAFVPTPPHRWQLSTVAVAGTTLAPQLRIEVDQCVHDGQLRWVDQTIVACGARFDPRTLARRQALGADADHAGRTLQERDGELYRLLGPYGKRSSVGTASAAIGLLYGDAFDTVGVFGAPERPGVVLAQPAHPSSARDPDPDRSQLRAGTFIVPSPDGTRFAVASAGAHAEPELAAVYEGPATGALQVW